MFWILVLITVLIICGIQTTALIENWYEGTIITTPENAQWRVWDVPFPAVTICRTNQLNITRLKEMKNEISPEEYE